MTLVCCRPSVLSLKTIIAKHSLRLFFCTLLDTGPVIYRNWTERSRLVSDIDSLTASGGGDCPEMAFAGMMNAFDESPKYGSSMFVFTDASAKDADLLNKMALKSMARIEDVTITFFTHSAGCNSCGIKDYDEISTHTGGKKTSCLKLFLKAASKLYLEVMIF